MTTITTQQTRIDALVVLLKTCEWTGYVTNGVSPECDWCGRQRRQGHASGCAFAAAVGTDAAKPGRIAAPGFG